MRVLYVEDNPFDADLTSEDLAAADPTIELKVVETYTAAIAALQHATPENPLYDIVLTDVRLPDGDGLSLLVYIRTHRLPMAVVVITGSGSEEIAVAALKSGADDYIIKEEDYIARLPETLRAAQRRFRAQEARYTNPIRVLYVEHHAADIDLTRRHLARYAPHIQLDVVHRADALLERLQSSRDDPSDNSSGNPSRNHTSPCDVILIDYRLPGTNALDILKEMERLQIDLPIVLVTGQGDEEIAVQAIRLGAADYLVKHSGYLHQLPGMLENTYIRAQLARERAALRQSEERYRSILELAPIAVYTKDRQGRYTSANPVAVRELGRNPIGLTDFDLQPPEYARSIWEVDSGVMESGESVMLEGSLSTRQGERSFLTRKTPLRDSSGAITGLLGVSLDITDRKQAQDYLAQQERLAAVGQMAAGIAHDFNNILAVILLYSQVLQLSIEKPDDRRRIETIREQAQHAANLVQQILDFSRRSSMSRVSLNVVSFVKEMVQILRRTLPENIRIEFAAPDEPLMIQVDPGRLQQALMNLAINARDAMPEGGSLKILIDALHMSDQDELPLPRMAAGNWLRLRVIDTGTGIASDVLPYIFDPFFTTKEPGSGTGLGLAQVHGIIRQFDGQIDVTSEVGSGTEFSIFLPLQDAPEVSVDASGAQTPTGSGETILLVEDEPALRAAVEEMLSELGYEVLVASDGREALGIFAQHRDKIDLLLSDVVMPEMSGVALVREIVKEKPDLKVVFATGYAPIAAAELAEEGLMIAWLHKPFSIDELATSVRNQLQ